MARPPACVHVHGCAHACISLSKSSALQRPCSPEREEHGRAGRRQLLHGCCLQGCPLPGRLTLPSTGDQQPPIPPLLQKQRTTGSPSRISSGKEVLSLDPSCFKSKAALARPAPPRPTVTHVCPGSERPLPPKHRRKCEQRSAPARASMRAHGLHARSPALRQEAAEGGLAGRQGGDPRLLGAAQARAPLLRGGDCSAAGR